jgi:ribosomal protein S18 acetylase RimI-like enzyme
MACQTDTRPPAFELRAIDGALADYLGPALAAIEPWSVIAYPANRMTAFLAAEDPALRRFAVMVGETPAGAVAIRRPWLCGSYLQLLAVLPSYQGLGLGSRLIRWFEEQAVPPDRWLWLCCSAFNTRAAAFYQMHGYETAATLPDLLIDGMNEFLMRKRCRPAA